jgi:hypothetical protein
MGRGGFGWKSERGRNHVAKKSPPKGFARQGRGSTTWERRDCVGSSQKRAREEDDGERDRWPKMPSEKNRLARHFFGYRCRDAVGGVLLLIIDKIS